MSVIVIGAGMAGLKAASTLHKYGVKDIKVLESRDRIGGRLHTVTGFDGVRKYDLGASWHHDTLCNDLFFEECELGGKFVFDDDFFIYIDQERGRVDRDPEMGLEIIDREISKFADMEYYQKLGTPDVSFQELTLRYLYEKRQFLTDDQIRYSTQVARYLELWHGLDWKMMSAKDTYFGHQGRNAMALYYGDVVGRIAKTIPAECIELGAEVNGIKREKSKTIVTTKDGREFSADYCIVAVPQSVLELSVKDETKKEVGRIEFTPPLRKSIEAGFDLVHFGGMGKVIFEFDQTCWSTESSKLVTLASTSDKFASEVRSSKSFVELLTSVNAHDSARAQQTRSCWDQPLYFINLSKTVGTASFMMLMQSPLTEYIEAMGNDKEKVFEFFKPALDSIMANMKGKSVVNGLVNVPEGVDPAATPVLRNIIVTNWTQDKYSRGAYTACHPGDDALEMIVALEQGQSPSVRFAGEHTIVDGAGGVNGAWSSGLREAEYIAEQLNLKPSEN
mgnify:CR=1 FL=1